MKRELVPRWAIAAIAIAVIVLAIGWIVWQYRQRTAPVEQPPHEVGPPLILKQQPQPSPPSQR